MAKTIKEERLRWVLPIINKEMKLVDIAKVFPYGKRSLERWVSVYKKEGAQALEPKSTQPKTQPHETTIALKEYICSVRGEKKKCAQKIHWQLKRTGLIVPVRTIGKILKDRGLTRKYRIKKVQYTYLRSARKPGELIEIDVKHVPGEIAGRKYYQYTAIDTASRWRYLRTFDEESTYHTCLFLRDVLSRFPHRITGVKTDNHSTFTNRYHHRSGVVHIRPHALDTLCAQHGITHYLIDPGKPAQNGTVERSHREDQEKFYEQNIFVSVDDLKYKMKLWNMEYNDLEHCGLMGLTPNEFLRDYQFRKPPNVLA